MKFVFEKCVRHFVIIDANSLEEAKEMIEQKDMIKNCKFKEIDEGWEVIED